MKEMNLLNKGRFTDEAWVAAKVLEQSGKSIYAIAQALGTQKCVVKYNLARPKPSLRPPRCPPKVKNPALLQRRREEVFSLSQVVEVTSAGPRRKFPSASRIAAEWNRRNRSNTVCASTVRRDLRVLGLVSKKRQRGPKRCGGDEDRRLHAARGWLKRGRSVLSRVGFSDAKYFDSNQHGYQREWCRPGQEPSRQTKDTWAPRVHVWGFIAKGMKLLVRIPNGKPTASSYTRTCLVPLVRMLANTPGGSDVIFQYDGDTAYGAGSVLKYLERKGVKTLTGWPARSPDLSPIENMWAIVQSRVDRVAPEDDAESLWKCIQQVWDEVPLSVVNNLVGSFPTRLRKCVGASGKTISTKTKGHER